MILLLLHALLQLLLLQSQNLFKWPFCNYHAVHEVRHVLSAFHIRYECTTLSRRIADISKFTVGYYYYYYYYY